MLRKAFKNFFRNKWVRGILIFHLISAVLAMVLFFYVRHLTISNFEQAIEKAPYDAIIVPGYPFKDSTWHDIMKARVHWSKYLFDQGYTKNIIYSGSAVYSPFVESKIMKSYAIKMGLPPSNLFAETKAEHSTENVYYSLQIARKKGFVKVALASDPFQSFFLTPFASYHDLNIDYMPIQYNQLNKLDLTDPIIDPSSAFVPNFVALPERQGFFERFRGTLGHYIN